MSDPYAALAAALGDVVRKAVEEALSKAGTVGAEGDTSTLCSVADAAHRLGLGTTTVKRLIAAGRLRSVLVGRRRLVPVDAIAEYAGALSEAS